MGYILQQGQNLASCLSDRRMPLIRGHSCVAAGNPSTKLSLGSLPLGEVNYLLLEEIKILSVEQIRPVDLDYGW